MAEMKGPGGDGFAVELRTLDGLVPIFDGIGTTIRSVQSIPTTAGADATGHEGLGRAVAEFGSLVSEYLGLAAAANAVDAQRVMAVRRAYDDVERTNAQRMLREEQRRHPFGQPIQDMLRNPALRPTGPSMMATPPRPASRGRSQ